MPDRPDTAALMKGAVAGLAAGLVASFVMNQAQALVQKLSPNDDEEEDEPATAKAADALSQALTGEPVSDDQKELAGNFVHYALGAALGVAYGIAAEVRPAITSGYGAGFGLSTVGLLDEAGVPATGLAPPPTETPLSTHAYAAASHLVFGLVAEGVRKAVRQVVH